MKILYSMPLVLVLDSTTLYPRTLDVMSRFYEMDNGRLNYPRTLLSLSDCLLVLFLIVGIAFAVIELL